VVVIGSGFGGAVSALRLAERGMRVLVLERGPWWGDGDPERTRPFPRGVLGARKLLRNVRFSRGGRMREWLLHSDGLFEVHSFRGLDAYAGSGVGGGSHVYTNMLVAPPTWLHSRLPPEIGEGDLAPALGRVRAMLAPEPLPLRTRKELLFEGALSAGSLGAATYPDLAVAFGRDPAVIESRANAAGVTQNTCRYCGECIVGCTTRAKTTLDLTYLPAAIAAGAEVRALAEVHAIEADGSGYLVRYRDHAAGRGSHSNVRDSSVRAERVVLAAGTLNTVRLLFEARDRHRTLPGVSPMLGRRFSPNGDMVSVLLQTGERFDGLPGPSVGAVSEARTSDGRPFLVGAVAMPIGALPFGGVVGAALRRTACFIAMGADHSSAALSFDAERGLSTDADRSMDPAMFEAIEAHVARIGAGYKAWRLWANAPAGRGGRRLETVHPLGGASYGRSSQDGVVDHRGQVFGHERLYVADGSLYPAAPGVPPSLGIAAFAERQAALME
jgi:cholesterol oxidase